MSNTLKQFQDKNSPRLTSREKEILFLIAHEYCNSEISRLLFLAKSTIDTHRKRLLFKLDVKNSAGLIRKAYEYNYLPMEAPANIMESIHVHKVFKISTQSLAS